MQIRALYDGRGRILAAAQVETADTAKPSVPTPQPQPKHGQRVGLFTVPPEHAHLSFADACTRLVVKTVGKHAMLAALPTRKSARRSPSRSAAGDASRGVRRTR